MDNKKLGDLNTTELKKIAKEEGVKNWWTLKKVDLINEIGALRTVAELPEPSKPETKKKTVQAEDNTQQEDIITLKEIILDLGVKGTKARRVLRNELIDRPYKRWEWHKELHKDIITKVKSLLS